jgi:hypothetical protein
MIYLIFERDLFQEAGARCYTVRAKHLDHFVTGIQLCSSTGVFLIRWWSYLVTSNVYASYHSKRQDDCPRLLLKMSKHFARVLFLRKI